MKWVVLVDGNEDLLRQVYAAAKRYKVDMTTLNTLLSVVTLSTIDSILIFSDVRKLITQAALDKDLSTLCSNHGKPTQKSFIGALLRTLA